jgi:phytoene/squalene synthetase
VHIIQFPEKDASDSPATAPSPASVSGLKDMDASDFDGKAPGRSWPSLSSLRGYLKSHFAPAFYFLTPHRRRALKLLYAVCRLLDDAVDKSNPNAKGILAAWRRAIETGEVEPLREIRQEALGAEFLDMMKRFELPRFALIDLIDQGVARDLEPAPFETAMDFESYCYGVVGTVGIFCFLIFGVSW